MTKTATPAKTTSTSTEKVEAASAAVVASLIEQIEAGADGSGWAKVWKSLARRGGAAKVIGGQYNGGNYIACVMAEMTGAVGPWGTYKQWEAKGSQVRKGEHGLKLLRPMPFEKKAKDGTVQLDKNGKPVKGIWFQVFSVFSSNQVDGWDAPVIEPTAEVEKTDALGWAEQVVEAHNVAMAEGEPAFWPVHDRITMPAVEHFYSADAYVVTLGHELTHWTGAKTRLARDLSGRFGDHSYAAEELVAELGAAFIAARLGLTDVAPRADHTAQYLANWLACLKETPSRLWTAASAAEKAVGYLVAPLVTEVAEEDLVDA